MYWLSRICVQRPVFATMLIAALVVAGLVSFPSLGVDRFPNADLPTVYIRTGYAGQPAEVIESEVTKVIEDEVATVGGIDELRSISSDGGSFVILTFQLNRDIDVAVQDVRDAIADVADRLPEGTETPIIRKSDLDSSPVITMAVSGNREPKELFYLADRYVKNVIESAAGVGEVEISGSADRAIQIRVDAQRLAAFGVSILEVRDAIARQNREVPGGRVDQGTTEITMRTQGRIADARQFGNLVIRTIDGVPVRLSDVADVVDDTKEVRRLARLNGKPAVVLQAERQSGENTVRVIEAIKEKLPRSRSLLPDDVEVTILQDQSRYINAALHEIESHLISGSILACLCVLLFMRSWRSTIIAAVAIPTSIVGTFAFMNAFGFTLNNVTMLALVLMVGVVIDDAIVVLENIFRFIEEKGASPRDAAIEGTKEIGLAVLATTLSLVIVFLPVSFLSSVTGRILFQFGITASIAIMISMLVSFTLTPMMCSLMLKSADGVSENAKSKKGIYAWVESAYLWCLRWSLRFRWVTMVVVVLLIGANWPIYGWLKQDYIPTNVDESEFEVRLSASQGANMISMNDVMQKAEREVMEVPGVELVLSTVGTGGLGSVNRGRMYVQLTDIRERSFSFERLLNSIWEGDWQKTFAGNFTQQEKMTEIRERLKKLDDVRASVRNQTSLRQGAPVDIDFSITGPSIERLIAFSEEFQAKAEEIPGLVDIDRTLRVDKPELWVGIHRERAAAMGVSVTEIAETLRLAVGGDDQASRFLDESVDDAYDVELRLEGIDRDDPESISQLLVRVDSNSQIGALGGAVEEDTQSSLTRIDNLIYFSDEITAARVDRLNRQRMVAVRANIEGGYSLSGQLDELNRLTEQIGLPAGFDTIVMGGGRELLKTLDEFKWVFFLSFVFMYIVLAAQFEHMVHPLTILLSLPIAVPFGLLGLYWGGESLNVYSALGLLVLFGVVKKAAILQVDHTRTLAAQGMPRQEAILRANADRLRPILMTTLSFVAGMIPLLIGTGPGAEERRSIATLAVYGQSLSLFVTLLAVPVMYSIFDDVLKLFRTNNSS